MKQMNLLVPFVGLLFISFNLSAQVYIELRPHQPPELKIAELDDKSIKEGESAQIGGLDIVSGGTEPYLYSWEPTTGLDDSGISNPIASPNKTTTYILTVFDGNNCSLTGQVTVIVQESTGYDINDVLPKVSLYPNPNPGTFRLEFENVHAEIIQIQFLNILGEVVEQKNLDFPSSDYIMEFDWNLSPGVYLIFLKSEKFIKQIPVVIQ